MIEKAEVFIDYLIIICYTTLDCEKRFYQTIPTKEERNNENERYSGF